MILAAIAIVSALAAGVVVDGHSDGAPDTACSSMTPGHQGTAMRAASTAVHRLQGCYKTIGLFQVPSKKYSPCFGDD